MTTKYERSPWIEQFPKSRVPSYPAYRGAATTDVVVVGGGLTGCTVAYALAANGIKVMLLDGGQIGRGSSGRSAGIISDDPGVSFTDIEKLHGLRFARRVWQAWRRGALDFAALLRRLEIRCYLESHPMAVIGVGPNAAAYFRREIKSRRDAGLETTALNARAIASDPGVSAVAGLRLKDSATIDPYRATLGLAAAARVRGAKLFERSAVQKVTFDRKAADVKTAAGTIHAAKVVIASGVATTLWRSLARHFWFRAGYAALTEPVPAKIRNRLGPRTSLLRDNASPPHLVRWVDDRLLISGADHDEPPARRREPTIVQRTGQLMYELSLLYPDISGIQPSYGWDASYVRTADGLPYIGPHRNLPHQLFALGDSGHGLTTAYLASRIVLRHLSGELDPVDEVFAFTR